jgi:hypothetical protein
MKGSFCLPAVGDTTFCVPELASVRKAHGGMPIVFCNGSLELVSRWNFFYRNARHLSTRVHLPDDKQLLSLSRRGAASFFTYLLVLVLSPSFSIATDGRGAAPPAHAAARPCSTVRSLEYREHRPAASQLSLPICITFSLPLSLCCNPQTGQSSSARAPSLSRALPLECRGRGRGRGLLPCEVAKCDSRWSPVLHDQVWDKLRAAPPCAKVRPGAGRSSKWRPRRCLRVCGSVSPPAHLPIYGCRQWILLSRTNR